MNKFLIIAFSFFFGFLTATIVVKTNSQKSTENPYAILENKESFKSSFVIIVGHDPNSTNHSLTLTDLDKRWGEVVIRKFREEKDYTEEQNNVFKSLGLKARFFQTDSK